MEASTFGAEPSRGTAYRWVGDATSTDDDAGPDCCKEKEIGPDSPSMVVDRPDRGNITTGLVGVRSRTTGTEPTVVTWTAPLVSGPFG